MQEVSSALHGAGWSEAGAGRGWGKRAGHRSLPQSRESSGTVATSDAVTEACRRQAACWHAPREPCLVGSRGRTIAHATAEKSEIWRESRRCRPTWARVH